MPAFVTHELLGTQVFSMLDEPIAEMLELNPSPYFWGLQDRIFCFSAMQFLEGACFQSTGTLCIPKRQMNCLRQ